MLCDGPATQQCLKKVATETQTNEAKEVTGQVDGDQGRIALYERSGPNPTG